MCQRLTLSNQRILQSFIRCALCRSAVFDDAKLHIITADSYEIHRLVSLPFSSVLVTDGHSLPTFLAMHLGDASYLCVSNDPDQILLCDWW